MSSLRQCRRPFLRVIRVRFAGAIFSAVFLTTVQAQEPARTGDVVSPRPSAPSRLDAVEVSGESQGDKRDAVASKLIVSREEIARFGDTSLGDVLRRLPGVTVSGSGMLDPRDIKLRGLGNGYTQILLNGAPLPPGFPLADIAPELIERVEIQRSATAEAGSNAIAGVINIILRKTPATRKLSLKVSMTGGSGGPGASVSGQASDRAGDWTYGGTLTGTSDHTAISSATDVASWIGGEPSLLRRTDTSEQRSSKTVGVAPRVAWTRDASSEVSLDGLLQYASQTYQASERRRSSLGAPPRFAMDDLSIPSDVLTARATLQYKSAATIVDKVETRLNINYLDRSSKAALVASDAGGVEFLHRAVSSDLSDFGATFTGKASLALGENHALSAGWEGTRNRRAETRIQREEIIAGDGVPEDLDEGYAATISSLALYVQDEWEISRALSIYLGARWERADTATSSHGQSLASSRAATVSPTFQLLWKVAGTRGDQVRLNVGRTYRLPTARELVPRRWVVNDNSPTDPNFQGNPALRPERAWGIDLGYERYLAKDAFAGINAYARHIDDVVLQQVESRDGVWTSVPVNGGRARVLGIEGELRGGLKALVDRAPDLQVRVGATRNWSRVDAVPGPDNRLSRQPRVTLSLGVDYRPHAVPIVVGGAFSQEHAGRVQLSATQAIRNADRRQLDLYADWTLTRAIRLRTSVMNAFAPKFEDESAYFDETLRQEQRLRTASRRQIKVALEMAL